MRFMELPNFWSRDACHIIADTSAIINLNASLFAREILAAFPGKISVVGAVFLELEQGAQKGHRDAQLLRDLQEAGALQRVELDERSGKIFEDLVLGSAALTLDDGEAATIAYAVERGIFPVIDERKAHRVCKERYPTLRAGCTMDIFSHNAVQKALGRDNLAASVKNALANARMRVFPHYLDWVMELIGRDNAAHYASLPYVARSIKR
jgi:predicted nucleic acid-binding protein